MAGLLFHLLPLALYAAFAPVAALVCILLLESTLPLDRAGAYGLGYVVALVVVGAVGAAVLGRWAGPGLAALLAGLLQTRVEPSAGWEALSVVTGLGLLAFAARRWRRRDPRAAALPKWLGEGLGAVEGIGPLRAFGLGALLFLVNVDNVLVFLAGINDIGEAGLGPAGGLLAAALLILVAAVPALAPLAAYLLGPARADVLLAALKAWIGRLSQAAVAALLAAVGLWLVVRGVAGLLS